jgi:DNA-binding response OmpR family regulator
MSTNGTILYVGETARPAALDLVLEGQGYKILTASDLKHALRVLEVREFEAMVVEQRLLHEDGELWRQVSASYPGMPVLGIAEPPCGKM